MDWKNGLSHDSTQRQLVFCPCPAGQRIGLGDSNLTAGVTSTGGWKWGVLHFDPQPCGNAFTAKRPLPTIAKTLSCLEFMEMELEATQTETPWGIGGTEHSASSTSTRTAVVHSNDSPIHAPKASTRTRTDRTVLREISRNSIMF